MKPRVLLLIFFAVGLLYRVDAQKILPAGKEVNFTSYGLDEGLEILNILNVYQDSKGFIWACSKGAVVKFDGLNFKTYSREEGLPSGGAGSVCEDNNGNMWFGTWKGLAVLKDNKFILDTSKGMPRNLSWNLFKDKDGTIWAATGKGVFHIDPNKIGNAFIKAYPIAGDGNANNIRCIYRKKNNKLLAGTESGCYVLEKDSFVKYIDDIIPVYEFIELEDGREWCSGWGSYLYQFRNGKPDTVMNLGSHVLDMTKDKNGNVFLATWDKGVFKYDGKNFINYGKKEGLDFNSFWSTYCDDEGNLWFGSWGGGLFKYSGEQFTRISEKSGLVSDIVNGIGQTKDGKIWISSQIGINSYDPLTNEIRSFDKVNNQPLSKIICMQVDSDEVLGAGYSWGGYRIKKDKLIPDPDLNAFCLLRDKIGFQWHGTDNNGAYKTKDGKSEHIMVTEREGVNRVVDLYEDNDGNIWLMNDVSGVTVHDGKTLKHFYHENGFVRYRAIAIAQHKKDQYFIACSKGFYNCVYSGTSLKIIDSIQKKDGLISDEVITLNIFDSLLYIGGIRGLSIMKLKDYYDGKKLIKNYTADDGILGKACSVRFKDQSGLIWFSTFKGAYCYDPRIRLSSIKETPVHIIGLKLFFEEVEWDEFCKGYDRNYIPKELNLPYDKNHLSFTFVGINHKAPKKVLYQYKLEGLDKDWSPPTDNRSATYSNISPGTYTFMIKACNNDGVWNKTPVKYIFIIKPPFWQTAWFYVLSTISSLLALYFFIRWREKKLQREKSILEKRVNERTRQLQNAYGEIEEKQKEIIDSIKYAKRIQISLLASDKYIEKNIDRLKKEDKK